MQNFLMSKLMVHMTKSCEYNKGMLLTIGYTQNIES